MGVSDISADAGRASPSCWGPTKGQVLVSTVRDKCGQRQMWTETVCTETNVDRDKCGQRQMWTETNVNRDKCVERQVWAEKNVDRDKCGIQTIVDVEHRL